MENATEWMRGLRALISYAHRGIRMGNLEYLKLPDACRTAVDAAAQTMHDDPELAAGNRRGNWPPTPTLRFLPQSLCGRSTSSGSQTPCPPRP